METNPVATSKKDYRSFFAIISLVLGVLDLPILFCGFFFALALGMGGMVPLFVISLLLPVVICLVGLVLGIFGLRSKYKWAAIVGIVIPVIYLSMICVYFSYTMVLHPGSVIMEPIE